VITLPCFLHQLNTIIGKIVAFAAAKRTITNTTRVVSFFVSSHYWGGQEDEAAKKLGITRSLKTHTKSRWYSLITQNVTFQSHRPSLTDVCIRPDAQKKTNGLSPVNSDVIDIVMARTHWPYVNQIICICKPLVDAIGNTESRQSNLADCMLELLRCARTLNALELESGEDPLFLAHARAVFNCEFIAMNTELHCLALFLHPLCKNLALDQTAKNRTYDDLLQTAVNLAVQ
jgi:hypothetical protein